MKLLSHKQAREIIEMLTEQEITEIFNAGKDHLNTMGVSSAYNPDGFFYNKTEQIAVNVILDPTTTIPDELYSDVQQLVSERDSTAQDRFDEELNTDES